VHPAQVMEMSTVAAAGLATALAAAVLMFAVAKVGSLTRSPRVLAEVESARSYWEGSSWIPALPVLKAVAAMFEHFDDSALSGKIVTRLRAQGNALHLEASDFYAICALTGAAFAAAGALFGFGLGLLGDFSIGIAIGLGVMGAIVGAMVPVYYLVTESDERVREVDRDLPYALDLMQLMIEGGATIPEALGGVTRQSREGPLRDEFGILGREVQMGSTFEEAFANLGERIPSEDLNSIVRAISQGIQMGTPISSILREQADLLRLKRTQRAEKFAKQAGSRMTFPIMLIMMATFLLVLGPAVLQFTSGDGLAGLR